MQDSAWLEHLGTPKVPLSVSFAGAGEIQSDLPGVDCTSPCTTQWDSGTLVALTALPAKTDRFVHWTGACHGAGDCSVTLDERHVGDGRLRPAARSRAHDDLGPRLGRLHAEVLEELPCGQPAHAARRRREGVAVHRLERWLRRTAGDVHAADGLRTVGARHVRRR